jgi:hypothetical protein
MSITFADLDLDFIGETARRASELAAALDHGVLDLEISLDDEIEAVRATNPEDKEIDLDAVEEMATKASELATSLEAIRDYIDAIGDIDDLVEEAGTLATELSALAREVEEADA